MWTGEGGLRGRRDKENGGKIAKQEKQGGEGKLDAPDQERGSSTYWDQFRTTDKEQINLKSFLGVMTVE